MPQIRRSGTSPEDPHHDCHKKMLPESCDRPETVISHLRKGVTILASSDAVSRRMARTPGKDNLRERTLRSELHRQGFRFRIHLAAIPGTKRTIDIAFTRSRLAVFCDGCFWHGCPLHASTPKTNREWWMDKIAANKARDRDTDKKLMENGWNVLRIWEHVSIEEAVALIRVHL